MTPHHGEDVNYNTGARPPCETVELNDSTSPRPSLMLVLAASVVIGSSLILISLAIAALTITWDPCSLFAGAIILPLPLVLAVQQYRGVFHRRARAAFTASVLLFVVAGFVLFGFATSFGQLISDSMPLPWLSFLLPMLAVGLGALHAGVLNLRWSRRISGLPPPQRSRFSAKCDFAALMLSVIGVAAMTSHFIQSTPPRYAVNVSRDEAPFGLPPGATEISFCQGYRGTIAYEFTIDEASFVEWVRSGIGSLESEVANIALKPITEPVTIQRYHGLSADLDGPGRATIEEGLYYAWSKEDRGVYAAFDRKRKRGYYFAHYY